MKPALRVVEGGSERRNALADARARARPLLRRWLQEIERHIAEGRSPRLSHGHAAAARHLTCYPSANEGRCYAGQERIGKNIGRTSRTARQYLADLCLAGFLSTKRGAPGRTSAWHFEIGGIGLLHLDAADIDGKELSDLDRKICALDRKKPSALDRKKFSDKPIEDDPIERKPFTTTATGGVDAPGGLARKDWRALANDRLWQQVLGILCSQYGDDIARAWFRNLRVVQNFECVMTVEAPNAFHRDWIVNNYGAAIQRAIKKIDADNYSVDFIAAAKPSGGPATSGPKANESPNDLQSTNG